MIESYKLFENIAKARKILDEIRTDENNPKFIELKKLLSKNPGYLGSFTKWYLQDNESMSKIEEVYKLLLNTNIDKPIDTFDKLEDLYDYIQSYEINKKVNQVINSLPSGTRNMISDNKKLFDELKNTISLNIEYAKLIKDLYSKKGGRYKEPVSLVKDTKDYIKNLKGGFNSDTIKKKLEGLNIEIVVDTPEILMIKVNDYSASCKIGSKHWCISTSQSYWNNYVNEFTNQYFIFDFTKDISDKKHMIGTTISPSGKITSAHWSDDTTVTDLSYFDSL